MIENIIILFLFFIVLVIGGLLYVLVNRKPTNWRGMIEKKLEEVDRLVHTSHENDMRTALIKMDSLLDAVLQQKKVRGESLGERLKNARHLFDRSTYNNVWEAHKLRNKIVHEIDFRPPIAHIKEQYMELRMGVKQVMKG